MKRKRPGCFVSDSVTSEISQAAPVTNVGSVCLRAEGESEEG